MRNSKPVYTLQIYFFVSRQNWLHADDNDDAVKLRTAINIANRRRPKPYDRSVQPTFADVESFFVANINQQRQKLARNRQHFNRDILPDSAHTKTDNLFQGNHQVPQLQPQALMFPNLPNKPINLEQIKLSMN